MNRITGRVGLGVDSWRVGAGICVATVLGFLAPTPSFAETASGWSQPAFKASAKQLWQLADQHKAKPGTNAVVLYEGVHYTFDKRGRTQRVYRRVFKVYDQSAASGWGYVEAGWAPWFQERPTIKARVLTPDGRFHELDPRTLTEMTAGNAPHVYSDFRTLKGPLPAMAAGSIVEEQTIFKETRLFFDQGKVYRYYFGSNVPVAQTEIVIDAPKSLRLRFKNYNVPELRAQKIRKGGKNRWVYRLGAIEPIDHVEQALPGDVAPVPHIAFAPGRSWQKLARRYHEVVEQQIAKGTIGHVPFTISAKGRPRAQVIRDTLAFLHANVRYTGLEFGQSSIVPWTPSETWTRKYGDCKDQAILLVALLRRAGIKAHVALLDSGFDQDVEPSMPSLSQFDHAIVYVPGKKPVWIDPTDEFTRAGELPLGDRGRLALIIAKNQKRLTRTPEARSKDNVAVEEREIFLADYGGARVVETSYPTGSFETGYRRGYRGSDPQKVRENLAGYMKNEYLAQELVTYTLAPIEDVSKPFSLRIEARDARRSWTEEKRANVYLYPTDLLRSLPPQLSQGAIEASEKKDAKPRVNDFVFHRPYVREQWYRIHIPAGFALRRLPENTRTKLGTATFSAKYRQDGDVVHATLRLDTGKRRLTPKQLTELRAALTKLRREKAIELVFDHRGMALMAEGQTKRGLAEMETLAKRLPRNAVHRARLAQAFLDVGLGEPARAHGSESVTLDPKSQYALWTYGWILSHDLLGRRFVQGYDRAGAIAAYRKLSAMDKTENRYRTQLAEILERDERGVQFGAGADLAGAVEVYRSLREESKSEASNEKLLTAMYHADRCRELLESAATMDQQSAKSKALTIACTALSRGVPRALEEATAVTSGVESRRQVLDAASGFLALKRHYQRALAVSQEASRGASNRAARQLGLDILAKVRRHEDVKIARGKPESLFPRLMVLFLQPEKEMLPRLRKLMSRRALAGADIGDVHTALQGLDMTPNTANQRKGGAAALIDFAISLYDVSVDAAKPWGYQLTLKPAVSIPAPTVYMYSVREGGKHRLLGSSEDQGPLGAEALQLANRKKLAGARQWLDWAREHWRDPNRNDPFSGAPFASLWTKGKKGDRTAIRRAAASLMVRGKQADKAVPILKKCAAQGGADALPCKRALIVAYRGLDRHAEALTIIEELSAGSPDAADSLYWQHSRTLLEMDRWNELAELARKRIADHPDEKLPKHLLADAATGAGDVGKAFAIYRDLLGVKDANDHEYNQFAWVALFVDRTGDDVLDAAKKAVQLSGRKDDSDLNTLAAVHAARGELQTAYQVMLESMSVGKRVELKAQDWVVYGRIAQGYGLFDIARAAYDKVEASKSNTPAISSHALAGKWRATLPAPAP